MEYVEDPRARRQAEVLPEGIDPADSQEHADRRAEGEQV